MKLSYKLLRKYLSHVVSVKQVADTLVRLGIEVEEIVHLDKRFAGIVIGRIVEITKHPNADKLNVCIVDLGKMGLRQIVCGAKNVRIGLTVAVATPNTTIPNGSHIVSSSIRGIESNGMICSFAELGIAFVSDGIAELMNDLVVGNSFSTEMYDNDIIFDLSITPNRGDCNGIIGIATDLAAGSVGKMTRVKNKTPALLDNLKIDLSVPSITSCVLIDVTDASLKSPKWLYQALNSIGIQSSNVLQDIVHYVSYMTGSVINIYDGCAVSGTLCVRYAKNKELFLLEGNKEICLNSDTVVLSCDNGILSVVGVATSSSHKVTDQTKKVIIECSYLEPDFFIPFARNLGILSSSRHKMERGIDFGCTMDFAMQAALEIVSVCGGSVIAYGHADSIEKNSPNILYKTQNIRRIVGLDVPAFDVMNILHSLGFTVEAKPGCLSVTVPTSRHDISLPEDITEEIIRLLGLDSIPLAEIPFSAYVSSCNSSESFYELSKRVKKIFASRGYKEVINYMFVEQEIMDAFTDTKNDLCLIDPLNNLDVIQSSAIPNLIKNLKHNLDRYKFNSLSLFEITSIFSSCNKRSDVVAGISYGFAPTSNSCLNNLMKPICIFDIKSDIVEVLSRIYSINSDTIDQNTFPLVSKYSHPYTSFEIRIDDAIVANFGQIHPALLNNIFKIDEPVFFFEIMINNIHRDDRKFDPVAETDKIIGGVAFDRVSLALIAKVMNITPGEIVQKLDLIAKTDNVRFKQILSVMDKTNSAVRSGGINFANEFNSFFQDQEKTDSSLDMNPDSKICIKPGISRSSITFYERNIAFILNKNVIVGAVSATIMSSSPFIISVCSSDVFVDDDTFGKDHYSVMFSFSLTGSRSFTREEITDIFVNILKNVETKHDCKLRGTLSVE